MNKSYKIFMSFLQAWKFCLNMKMHVQNIHTQTKTHLQGGINVTHIQLRNPLDEPTNMVKWNRL